jgi:AraC family transcriptional regulator of adaptative response/methylated-DNA-[protein]-cysteine methyltransferase
MNHAGFIPERRPAETLARIESPVGTLLAGAVEEGVCRLEFADRRATEARPGSLPATAPGEHRHLATLRRELGAYFAGKLSRFAVPLAVRGTEFQVKVWEALRRIPHGETRSYADIAREIGRPSAVRAVARANGDNRIAVLIPCHRVIGSDGSLTGYGGGLWRKEKLLEIEGVRRALFA